MYNIGYDRKLLYDLTREAFDGKWKLRVHQAAADHKNAIYIKVSISNISIGDEHWWTNTKLQIQQKFCVGEAKWKSIISERLQFANFYFRENFEKNIFGFKREIKMKIECKYEKSLWKFKQINLNWNENNLGQKFDLHWKAFYLHLKLL